MCRGLRLINLLAWALRDKTLHKLYLFYKVPAVVLTGNATAEWWIPTLFVVKRRRLSFYIRGWEHIVNQWSCI